MAAYSTVWHYFLNSSFFIKLIFITLFIASIITWIIIFQSILTLTTLKRNYVLFEREFWSDVNLNELYEKLPDSIPPEQIHAIFYAGFTEFYRLKSSGCQTLRVMIEGVTRAMNVAQAQSTAYLERHLHWLTIVYTSAPYLGLLGTLLSFISALSSVEQVSQPNTLLLIAPGLSEGLLLSVGSLLTTLPAIVFYSSYCHQLHKLLNQYRIFQEEFIELLVRQAYEGQHEKSPSEQ